MRPTINDQIAAAARASLKPPAVQSPPRVTVHREHRTAPWLVAAAILIFAVGGGVFIALRDHRSEPAPAIDRPPSSSTIDERPQGLVGSSPEISGTTIDGSTITLSSLQGSWVVIDFFATWCGPCQDGQQELIALSEADPGLKILTVAYSDDIGAVASSLAASGAPWPAVSVGPEALSSLHVTGVPTTFLVSPQGVITQVFQGLPTLATLESSIAAGG